MSEKEVVVIESDHPAWKALDDDDWCGSTLVNFLNMCKGHQVIIRPDGKHSDDVVRRLREAFERVSSNVTLEL